ncbi:hypothetical protein [Kribbia dieselivorans]|uniref:hypothetical protein n=1 Tax=Kribbia dieselivorans TaxID=331526 RepID=UPI000837F4C5|nr:hypothetical protein [Kribbia dieselivorans]
MARLRIALLAASFVAVSGCGNLIDQPEHVGRVGVSVTADGTPLIIVVPCRAGVAQVLIHESRTPDMSPDEQNREVGVWTAASPSSEPTELRLASPGPAWTGEPVVGPKGDTAWIVDATFAGEGMTTLVGPSVSADDLRALDDDKVLVDNQGNVEAIPRADLDGDCGR